jgi:hypothetical protein
MVDKWPIKTFNIFVVISTKRELSEHNKNHPQTIGVIFSKYFYLHEQQYNYLERECFRIGGFAHPDFHPYQDLLNDQGLTKGFTGIKGFFSCTGVSCTGLTGFFFQSKDSAILIFFTDKRLNKIYEVE